MKRLWRAAKVFARQTGWVAAPDWTEADARALTTFLGSATGAKLRVILRSEIAEANERAAMSRGEAFECGWACGYRGLYAWFEALAATERQPVEAPLEEEELEQLIP